MIAGLTSHGIPENQARNSDVDAMSLEDTKIKAQHSARRDFMPFSALPAMKVGGGVSSGMCSPIQSIGRLQSLTCSFVSRALVPRD